MALSVTCSDHVHHQYAITVLSECLALSVRAPLILWHCHYSPSLDRGVSYAGVDLQVNHPRSDLGWQRKVKAKMIAGMMLVQVAVAQWTACSRPCLDLI